MPGRSASAAHGNPKSGDLKIQVSLDRYLIQGGKLGATR
jgi:hypothetical protein